MPRIQTPGSDEGRAFILTKAISVGPGDIGRGLHYIDNDLIAAIGSFVLDQSGPPTIPGYSTLVDDVTKARAKWLKESGEAQTAWEELEVYLRDFFEVLKRRTARKKHDASVLAYFKLAEDGSLPVLSNREALEIVANNIVKGDADAVAAGFPAMANPSAAEVSEALTKAKTESSEVTPVVRTLEAAQRAVQAVRGRAIELVDDLIATLRYNTRKMEPGAARDIMRSYGVSFEYDAGETPDPTPAPTPTPAPAPLPTP